MEKERSKAREQEAFTARYSLVGMQEQLDQSHERIKMLEQERDAFKTLAKNHEDIAKIAAEGRLPLPQAEDEDDEFASPKKSTTRVVSTEIKSSATSEAEIEELAMLWQWEKHRAERALEHVEFLQAECELNMCRCMKGQRKLSASESGSVRRNGPEMLEDAEPIERVSILGNRRASREEHPMSPPLKKSKTERVREEHFKSPRHSTVFVPAEGIFRTVSQTGDPQMPDSMRVSETRVDASVDGERRGEPATPGSEINSNPPYYARTPSVEPPDFAMLAKQRTSLLSLLDAPHGQHSHEAPLTFKIPTTPGPAAPNPTSSAAPSPNPSEAEDGNSTPTQTQHLIVNTTTNTLTRTETHTVTTIPAPSPEQDLETRPHTSAAFYTSTTTIIPLKDQSENRGPSLSQRILAAQRTPMRKASGGEDGPSWDVTNPALTPTMTREQALAQIRERRARSGAVTPKRQMLEGIERRDVSAPVGGNKVVTPGRRVRS